VALKSTKSRQLTRSLSASRACFTSTPVNNFLDKKEIVPEAGVYQTNLHDFGKEAQNVYLKTTGRKELWKVNDNPGPGSFNHQRADSVTKFRLNTSAIISKPLDLYKRAREITPDAGYYQKTNESFCKDSTNITSMIRPTMMKFIKKKELLNISNSKSFRNNSPFMNQQTP
jgi:hypothetical protein